MGIDRIHELDNPDDQDPGGAVIDGLYVPPIGLYGVREMRWGNETPTQKALRESGEKLLDEALDEIKHERNIFADAPRDRPTGGTRRKPRS